ncbi:hypothetical protein BpHYR1_035817 [Brachionus plicatilis]|uniref:Uncharacterized protein n=1 Tax=Brachionus plicatilis TaxID=10195 RepID=A0A3M7SFC2_BRAPC|nr:hypothetical protein BpHYR1_035817 [Brachionus plicatilis]
MLAQVIMKKGEKKKIELLMAKIDSKAFEAFVSKNELKFIKIYVQNIMYLIKVFYICGNLTLSINSVLDYILQVFIVTKVKMLN